jgi:SRSO17 transposase
VPEALRRTDGCSVFRTHGATGYATLAQLTMEERLIARAREDGARREIRSAGKGSKGSRWYGWAWLATVSPRHYLLVRRHLRTGELAFHYCYVPEGQPLALTRLVRAAGLRWPVEEDFEFGKDCFGLDQSQVRLCTAIARHTVLVMAALAICAVTAALPKTALTPRRLRR